MTDGCLRCATLDLKWDELWATRVALLIELELIESQLSYVESGVAAHEAMNHEDAGESCDDPDCNDCQD